MFLVKCTYIDKNRNARFGSDPGYQETDCKTRGELFRRLSKEFGRCVSKMYRETKNQPDKVAGYVFEGYDKYSDTGKKYLRETWVEVKETVD